MRTGRERACLRIECQRESEGTEGGTQGVDDRHDKKNKRNDAAKNSG